MSKAILLKELNKFLSPEATDLLKKHYLLTKKYSRGGDRAINLNTPNTKDELLMLEDYLFNTDIPVEEIARQYNLTESLFQSRIRRVALRYIYAKGSVDHENGI